MDNKTKEQWEKIDGYSFEYEGETYWLRLGQYPNGRKAVLVMHESGPEAKLTVNLPEEETEDDQFWVKTHSRGWDMACWLKELGLMSPVQRLADAGYVADYAELWQLGGQDDV